MHPAIAGWVRRHIIDDDPNDHPEVPLRPADAPVLKPVYLTAPSGRSFADDAPMLTQAQYDEIVNRYERAMAEHRERQDKLEALLIAARNWCDAWAYERDTEDELAGALSDAVHALRPRQ